MGWVLGCAVERGATGISKDRVALNFNVNDPKNLPGLLSFTNHQIRTSKMYSSAIHFYLSQRYVSVSLVTIFRVSYSKNTSKTPVITQNMSSFSLGTTNCSNGIFKAKHIPQTIQSNAIFACFDDSLKIFYGTFIIRC
jgi:hypothetical protein